MRTIFLPHAKHESRESFGESEVRRGDLLNDFAVDDGSGDEHLAGGGDAAVPSSPWAPVPRQLVHVIPPVSFVPSPSGERVPVEKMEREVVEMYTQDWKARAQEVFLPFRRLCGCRSVETVVLEGDSVAEALVRYTVESGVRNLVLGSASLSWLRGTNLLMK